MTFTTKYEAPQYTATLEDATQTQEQNTFENYSRVTNDLFDHTDAGTVYDKTQLLNGGVSGQVGLAKSFSVVPGDTLVAEVYAKYFGTEGGPSNLTAFAAALTGAFGLSGATGGEQLLAYNALNDYGGLVAAGTAHGYDPGWPKGYLTVLVFNKDYVLVDAAWQQLDAAYVQTGATKMPHGLLSRQVIIKEPGYAYIYLSNEGSVQQDIYFDDVTITHKKSPIVQGQEYYPFGLTFNSYQKESTLRNDWKFQGQEHEDALDLNWDQFKWRNHQPDIGRFFNVDPLSDKYVHNSPYSFSENKVTAHVELEGLEAHPAMYLLKKEAQKVERVVNSALNTTQQTISDAVESIANAIGSIGNSEHGFILTSEKGGVRGGSSEGVRKGMGEELEVGHLLNPSTRKGSMDLVKDLEAETHVIENGIIRDETGKASNSEQSGGTNTKETSMPVVDGTMVDGNPSPLGTRSSVEVKVNDSTVVKREWESVGRGKYRAKVDTVVNKREN